MTMYPVPAVVALAGWGFAYYWSGRTVILLSLGWLAVHFARLNRVGEFNRAAAGILFAWWLHQSAFV